MFSHQRTTIDRSTGGTAVWSSGGATAACGVVLLIASVGIAAGQVARPSSPVAEHTSPAQRPMLADAQSLFYNAKYEAAAALTLSLRASDVQDLANDEVRSSALLFQLRGLLERRNGKDDALKNCAACPDLLEAFLADVHHGQALARARLSSSPDDEEALFYLGKLDLNYVWLQLGVLRRKTGWDEYWEARHSLDAVLKGNPRHVRARVARAWIDYIVDTKMPWGTRWLLGGGNKKKALAEVREASRIDSDFFSHAEAEFALWDMHVREREMTEATEVARRLVERFPQNPELGAFIEARAATPRLR
jgi:tetratricopeptide (TPR) repeat protein